MSREWASRRAQELRRQIRQHDYLYYVKNQPEISDDDYDELFAELVALETKHPALATDDSPTHRIGATPQSALPKVEHAARMMSLESSGDPEKLRRFDARIRQAVRHPRYVLEPKLDGVSVEVVYDHGSLIRAATRGDGTIGEGVTENLRSIRALPLRLRSTQRPVPSYLSVRGEVLMPLDAFEQLNAELLASGEKPFANPRNAVAGSLRQLDARVTAQRRLTVYLYDVLAIEGAAPSTQSGIRDALASWGLRTPEPSARVSSIDEVLDFHAQLQDGRDALAYEIDGVVIKLDDRDAHATLGATARHPRWAFAFKFAARRECSRVLDIVPSVGRTGVITPVAILQPVAIGGVTVSRASLHNREEVARKDVRIGDRVRIQRAGDVIPDIVERVAEPGRSRSAPYALPRKCPSCHTPLVARGPLTVCPNRLACPAQCTAQLLHVGSRAALNIKGLGNETANQLVNSGLVRSLPDLFDLRVEDVAALDGFAAKSAESLIAAIANASRVPLHRFLYALGIPEVGAKVAKELAAHFGSVATLGKASEHQLAALPGVGPRMASNIARFFRDAGNRRLIRALLDGRVTIVPEVGPGVRRAAKHLDRQ